MGTPRLSRAARIALQLLVGASATTAGCASADPAAQAGSPRAEPHPPAPSSGTSGEVLAPSPSASASAAPPPESVEPPRRVVAIYGSNEVFIAPKVPFGERSARVPPDADGILGAVAELLRERPRLYIVVVGNTDGREVPAAMHERLARQRAEAIAKDLIARGAPADRVRTEVDSAPAATSSSSEDRAQARRCRFRAVQQDGTDYAE